MTTLYRLEHIQEEKEKGWKGCCWWGEEFEAEIQESHLWNSEEEDEKKEEDKTSKDEEKGSKEEENTSLRLDEEEEDKSDKEQDKTIIEEYVKDVKVRFLK